MLPPGTVPGGLLQVLAGCRGVFSAPTGSTTDQPRAARDRARELLRDRRTGRDLDRVDRDRYGHTGTAGDDLAARLAAAP